MERWLKRERGVKARWHGERVGRWVSRENWMVVTGRQLRHSLLYIGFFITEGCHDGYIFLLIMKHAVLCIPSTYLEH